MELTLKALRINKGMTQSAMAEKLHVTKKTVGAWENGKTLPKADMVGAICELLGVSYDDIRWRP